MQTKEIKREIVNWNNDLTRFSLKGLNPSELDIFLAICYRCQRQGTRTIKITFDELRELSYFSSKDDERFRDRVLAVNKKLLSLSFEVNDGHIYCGFSLFSMYKIDTDNEYIEIAVDEHLAYLLNDFEKNYTSMELFEHASMLSTYSKAAYKRLRQFRNQERPFWKVTYQEFREYLNIPSNYRSCHIDANVLSVIIADNSKFFPNLKVEKYYEKPKGRGRSRLGGYIFTYDRPQNMDKYKPLAIDKSKEFKEEQRLAYAPESKTEMDMFPENVPFFD